MGMVQVLHVSTTFSSGVADVGMVPLLSQRAYGQRGNVPDKQDERKWLDWILGNDFSWKRLSAIGTDCPGK